MDPVGRVDGVADEVANGGGGGGALLRLPVRDN